MNKSVDLVNGKVFKSLIWFALPFLFSNLFQQLYNTIDTYIVGNVLNEDSLAAIGACAAVYELLVGFALGVGNGMSVVIARYYGANDEKNIRKSIGASFVISVGITIFIMLIAVFLLYPLLEVLRTDKDIIDEAFSYIFVITIFVGVMMAFNLFSGIMKAMGNSMMPLVFLVVSTIVNIILDYIFIAKIGTGIKGAAYATVIAQLISAILCFGYILKRYRKYLPSLSEYKIDKRLYIELFAQGVSMGLMTSIVSIGTVVLQFGINGLGKYIVAGHTAARKIFAFSTLPITTAGLSITTFVSQNKGANKPKRIREGIKYSIVITTIWSVIIAVLMNIVAGPLVKLVSGSNIDDVLANGTNYLKFNALFYTQLGVLIVIRCALQGLGQKILPLVSSIIELIGKVVFTFVLIPMMAYQAVIISEPVVWTIMAIYLVFAYIVIWKKEKTFMKGD